ncbi:hypothetical protein Tco_0331643 [Tanacetum coccineum]
MLINSPYKYVNASSSKRTLKPNAKLLDENCCQSPEEDLQILNEIQPLKQETPNQIQKDQEEKSIVELLAEERFQKDNQVLNEKQSPQEMKIQDLEIQKQQCLEEMKEWMNEFNVLSIEIGKITQEAKELRESEARVQSRKIIIDDDDDDLGFYAVHPNTIHIPVSQNVEPKDSLIMGDEHINILRKQRRIVIETLFQTQVESD